MRLVASKKVGMQRLWLIALQAIRDWLRRHLRNTFRTSTISIQMPVNKIASAITTARMGCAATPLIQRYK